MAQLPAHLGSGVHIFSLALYSVDGSFNPPDWRIQTARTLVNHGWPADHREADDHLAAAHSLLTHLDSDPTAEFLPASLGPLYTALAIHAADEPLRWVLEAALLAGETDRQISGRLGLELEVIRLYERTFFCVRGHLGEPNGCCGWRALGRDRGAGPRCGCSLLCFSYFQGPLTLDSLLLLFGWPQWLRRRDMAADIDMLDLRALIAVWLLPDYGVTAEPLVRIQARIEAWAALYAPPDVKEKLYRKIEMDQIRLLRLVYSRRILQQ